MASVLLRLEDSPPAGLNALVVFDPPLPMKGNAIDEDRAGEMTAVQLKGLAIVRQLQAAGIPATVSVAPRRTFLAPKGN